jgi:hypothetical protein
MWEQFKELCFKAFLWVVWLTSFFVCVDSYGFFLGLILSCIVSFFTTACIISK